MQKQLLEVFYKIGVLKNIAKFTEKHLFQSIFFKVWLSEIMKYKMETSPAMSFWHLLHDAPTFMEVLKLPKFEPDRCITTVSLTCIVLKTWLSLSNFDQSK